MPKKFFIDQFVREEFIIQEKQIPPRDPPPAKTDMLIQRLFLDKKGHLEKIIYLPIKTIKVRSPKIAQ